MNPVARFRRVFEARLRSGKYEPIDVVQAVKALSTKQQLMDSLDVWCALFDPDRPPNSRNGLELCRTTGYNLLRRALDLADATNELAELVLALAGSGSAALKDALLAKRLSVYRKRWDALDAQDRDEIQRRAKKLLSDRAAATAKQRFLLDDLEKEFRNRIGHAPQGGELYAFDPGPDAARKEFERLATGCEVAYFPKNPGTSGAFVMGQFVPSTGTKPQPEKNSLIATQNVGFAFNAFASFVEAQIKQPLDLFRLLAWAREPSAMNAWVERTRGQVHTHAVARPWSNVWPELYEEIAIRGLYVAVNRWRVAQMIPVRGYVGKDLEFLLAPLDRHRQELLKRRMADCWAPAAFDQEQLGRRRGKVWGDLKGLELVDELESESLLRELVNQTKANPKEVLERKITLSTQRAVLQGSYHIGEEAKDVFTVEWIPKQSRTQVVYVEVHALPGLLFRAWGGGGGLAELIEDKMYADLASNAAALAQFLLAYLQVLGYMLDIVTAGASGGVRVVVMRFVEERLKDAIINEGLDLAGVDNPWVRTLAGFAGGLVPSAVKAPKVGAVKGLEELEHDTQNVMRGGSRYKPKPQAEERESAPKPKAAAPEGSAPATPTVTPHAPELPPESVRLRPGPALRWQNKQQLEQAALRDPEAGLDRAWYENASDAQLRAREARDPVATEYLDERWGGPRRPFQPDRPSDAALQNRLRKDLREARAAVEAERRRLERAGLWEPSERARAGFETRSTRAGQQSVPPTAKAAAGYEGTVAVARTDIPALASERFSGGSPRALGSYDPAPAIRPPENVVVPQAHGHAEQDIAQRIDARLNALTPAEREAARGHTVSIRVDQEVCSTCAAGLGGGPRAGVLAQLSARHPDIVFEITADDTSTVYRIVGGRRVR